MPEFAILPETMPLRVQAKPWPRRETFAFVMKVVWQLSKIQNRFFKNHRKGESLRVGARLLSLWLWAIEAVPLRTFRRFSGCPFRGRAWRPAFGG